MKWCVNALTPTWKLYKIPVTQYFKATSRYVLNVAFILCINPITLIIVQQLKVVDIECGSIPTYKVVAIL